MYIAFKRSRLTITYTHHFKVLQRYLRIQMDARRYNIEAGLFPLAINQRVTNSGITGADST